MAISEMRRVAVLGHESRIGDVVTTLQRLGTVEVSADTADLSCPFNPAAGLAHVDSVMSELKYSIDIMGRHRRISKTAIESFTGYRLRLTDDEWTTYVQDGAENAHRIYAMARAVEQSLADLAAAETRILTSCEQLEPWKELRVPVEQVTAGRYVGLALGTAEPRSYEAALGDAAAAVDGLSWEVVAAEKDKVRLMVAYPMSAADDAIRALAQAGFAKVSFEQYSGIPSDIIAQLEADLRSIEAQRAQIERDIDALVEERPRAFALYDFFALERARLDVTHKFGGTERTFVVEGWVQLANLQEFRTAIEQIADDIVVLDRPPGEDEEPPVELENNRFASAFEPVTKMMGYPRQGSLDPSPFLGPFFLVFFGLCMTDAAYGIVIAALAYWLIGQTRARGMGRQFLNLLIMSGLATVFVGAMLGGWAGDLLQRLFGWRTAILFDPMEEPTKFLILSFALGVIQIYTGIILKAYDNIRRGDWLSAIFDQVFWLVFLTSIGLALGGGYLGPSGPAIASAGQKLLLASAIGLVLTQGRHHKNPLMRIGSGLLSLYNTTGYMSDIVSYARLFGLGFTSTVLASVMNDLMLRPAGIPVIGPIIALIGLVFGHLFNILINIIGAYVHSSRLQYVEFFGKFFEAGGRRFMPFGMSTKYVDVENAKGA